MVALPSFASGSSNGSRRSSSKNGKQKQANGASNGSSASNNTKSFLLARGWTSRLALPSILPPLRPDEMDKDLRHMQVYGNAVESYQQQHYMQMNRLSDNGGVSGHGGSQVVPSLALPVRIDPEEEKRLFNLRKKIVAAELLREQLEQEWVSNQAHYVHVAAKLRQTQSHRKETAQFLQKAVQRRGAVTAQARLRLQMTRDVLNALRYRMNKLQSAAGDNPPGVAMPPSDKPMELTDNTPLAESGSTAPVSEEAAKTGSDDTGDKMEIDQSGPATSASDDDQLTALWITAEEDYKKASSQMLGLNEKSKKKSDKLGVMPWMGSKLPTTPYEVPLLVSVLSTIPDKTVAFGPDPFNMTWIPNTLPDDLEDAVDEEEDATKEGDENNDDWLMNDEAADTSVLKARVARLEKDLLLERNLNTEWSAKIAASRKANDEWVAMMSLVRQETEALLHRHNILLESDLALTASEQLHEQLLQEKAENAAKKVDPEAANEDEADADDAPKEVSTSSNSIPPKKEETSNVDEAANYGDDEGSGEPEEDEKDEWVAGGTGAIGGSKEDPGSQEAKDSSENGNKRPSEGGDEESNSDAKRRKVEL